MPRRRAASIAVQMPALRSPEPRPQIAPSTIAPRRDSRARCRPSAPPSRARGPCRYGRSATGAARPLAPRRQAAHIRPARREVLQGHVFGAERRQFAGEQRGEACFGAGDARRANRAAQKSDAPRRRRGPPSGVRSAPVSMVIRQPSQGSSREEISSLGSAENAELIIVQAVDGQTTRRRPGRPARRARWRRSARYARRQRPIRFLHALHQFRPDANAAAENYELGRSSDRLQRRDGERDRFAPSRSSTRLAASSPASSKANMSRTGLDRLAAVAR